MSEYQIYPAGDSAVNVTFANRVDSQINQQIGQLQTELESNHPMGITGFVPAFRTLTVFYNPAVLSFEQLTQLIHEASQDTAAVAVADMRIVHIPVCYGQTYGPDLAHVAMNAGLTTQDVIDRHSQPNYLIYMLGFLPGFVYLGGLDKKIATPRLASPRLKIEPGAVGIAGEQTGIYPISSPGGWQIIGQTPLQLFQPQREDPFYYHAGDYIHFDVISDFQYQQIAKIVANGQYHIYVETRKVSGDGHSSDTTGVADHDSRSGQS